MGVLCCFQHYFSLGCPAQGHPHAKPRADVSEAPSKHELARLSVLDLHFTTELPRTLNNNFFVFFPTMSFQKPYLTGLIKHRIMWYRINLSKQALHGFYESAIRVFRKHCGEIARNEQFLLFPQCFLPVWRTLYHFYQI